MRGRLPPPLSVFAKAFSGLYAHSLQLLTFRPDFKLNLYCSMNMCPRPVLFLILEISRVKSIQFEDCVEECLKIFFFRFDFLFVLFIFYCYYHF